MLPFFFSTSLMDFFLVFFWPLSFSFFNAAPADGRWVWTGNCTRGRLKKKNKKKIKLFIYFISTNARFYFPELPSVAMSHIPHSLQSIYQSYLLAHVQLNPPVHLSHISALCNISHVISHPFPIGRRLLSHLTLPISPHPPLITAPLRFVQGTRYIDLPPSASQSPLCAPWCLGLSLHFSHRLVFTNIPPAHSSLSCFSPPKAKSLCCCFLFCSPTFV